MGAGRIPPLHAYFAAILALPVCALWLGSQGKLEKAQEIYVFAFQQPLVASSKWFHELYDKNIDTYTARLPDELAASARKRGRQVEYWSMLAELLEMLNM